MRREYLKIDNINGPLIEVTDVEDVFYGEVVNIQDQKTGDIKKGKVIKIDGTTVTIQVFQATSGLAAENSVIKFTGESFTIPTSMELMGRVFNGIGEPIDKIGRAHV